MTPDERALVAVSAALAARDVEVLDRALVEADGVCSVRAVEEALVQSYLFLGYPTALNALARWRALTGHPAGEPATDQDMWSARGAETCQAVYGGQYERLRDTIRALHPDMERWMVEEGYGKVLGRPGLALRVRELCVVGLLAVLDSPVQLYSHLRGALNVGAERTDVAEALEIAGAMASEGARARAAATWAELTDRTTLTSPGLQERSTECS